MSRRENIQFLIEKLYAKNFSFTVTDKSFLVRLLEEMASRPEIVTLCGSSRFGPIFHAANLKETIAGNIVLSIGIDTKSDLDLMLAGELTAADKDKLDQLHLRKVEMADRIVMINGPIGGVPYLGISSILELEHARSLGKPIEWLNYPTEYAIEGEQEWKLREKTLKIS
jgi:hypothetical protein